MSRLEAIVDQVSVEMLNEGRPIDLYGQMKVRLDLVVTREYYKELQKTMMNAQMSRKITLVAHEPAEEGVMACVPASVDSVAGTW